MNHFERLKDELEKKTVDIFEKRGGSVLVSAFTSAKRECLDAGIPESEVARIVNAVIEGAKR